MSPGPAVAVLPDGGNERPVEDWTVGVASAVITPAESMWMSGWGARENPSEGVEQELHAKAVSFEDDDGNRGVVVSVELLFVTRPLRDAVARRCFEAYGLSPDGLLVNATHTHCGPVVRDERVGVYGLDDHRREQAAAYRTRLEDTLVDLVGRALDDARPARLTYSRARCGFAMNRRFPAAAGITNEPYPDGPVDHDVPVLTVESGGSLRAVLFGYACHTTTMKYHLKFGGDWAGFAQEYVEERYPGATALFVLGCAGDQNPYPRGSVELAKRHGRSLATAVEAALEARAEPVHGPFRAVFEEQSVAFDEPPERAELERMADSDDPSDRTRGRALLDELERTGTNATTYPYPVQAFGFGTDLTLVALGGEVLVEYALRLKAAFPGRLWVAAYSNDDFTYVPTARASYEGGYEGGGVIRNTTFPGPLRPDVEERIVGAAHAAARRVSSPSGPRDDRNA